MSYTIPSWIPTWPTGWPDWLEAYRQAAVKAWPTGMWKRGSEAEKDAQAEGTIRGHARQLLAWWVNSVVPRNDTEGLFLDQWEAVFTVLARGTWAERVAQLEALMRQRGTVTERLLRVIMVAAFPGAAGDASKLQVTRGNWEELAGNDHDHAHARQQNHVHVSSVNGDLDPDFPYADELAAKLAPAVGRVSVGRYKVFRWNTPYAAWGHACWGDG